MLKIGLLGASKIAPTAVIVPAKARADVVIQAVGARDPDRARAYAATHGIPEVAAGYAALVERDDIDIVYIALPPAAHLEWTRRALAAGKAVLCEKPFAMNAAEARAMVAAATAARRPLIEAFHYRFHQVVRTAERLIRDGAIGNPRSGRAAFSVPIAKTAGELRWIRSQGGGALMDLGCYPLHALRTLFGTEPRVVRAEGEFEDGVDVSTRADLMFPGDIHAEIACSMRPEKIACRLTIEGDRGSLDIVNFVGPQMGGKFTLISDGETRDLDMAGPTTYAAQLDHVVQVMNSAALPLTGGGDAVAQMAAMDAIYAAAGRPTV